jgi:hypothetical protein
LLFGPNRCELIYRAYARPDGIARDTITAPRDLVQRMIDTHQLGEISEEGYPPKNERKKGHGYKLGWREMGLLTPGPGESYYLMLQ